MQSHENFESSFNGVILTKRPKEMSFGDYKNHLKSQKKYIKNYLKGTIYYLSTDIYYHPKDKYKEFGLRTTYPPFKGKMKEVLIPILHNNGNI